MAKIIFSNGDTKELTPTNGKYFSLKELKDVVGGWIEVIRLQNEYMVLNEEGKLCGLPLNITATNIVKNNSNYFNDYIVGNVIICGLDELN